MVKKLEHTKVTAGWMLEIIQSRFPDPNAEFIYMAREDGSHPSVAEAIDFLGDLDSDTVLPEHEVK